MEKVSPNGVVHYIHNGHCVTCGMGPHADWPSPSIPNSNKRPHALSREIDFRRSVGCKVVTVAELELRFLALGYRLDRRDDCPCTARYMTGPRAGESYPCVTTGLKEADTGISAWHVSARHDDRFWAMQELRANICAVTRGAILEV